MEGGNRVNIDLDAPLDVNTSDMLVPVNNPTFQHNWQKFQGKCLPNSLRFEMNGWAAGWKVYNLEYNLKRIKVNNKYVGAIKLNLNPTYAMRLFDKEKSDKILAEKIVVPESKSLTDGVTIISDNDKEIITGNLSDGSPFRIDWDTVGEVGELADEVNQTITKKHKDKNYIWSFEVVNDSESFSVDSDFYSPDVLSGAGLTGQYEYTCFDGVYHMWDDFKYDESQNKLYIPGVQGPVAVTKTNNHIHLDSTAFTSEDLLVAKYTIDTYYNSFNKCNVIQSVGDYMTVAIDASSKQKFNFFKVNIANGKGSKMKDLVAGDKIDIDVRVPIWLTLNVKPEYGDIDNHVKYPDNMNGIYLKSSSPKVKVIIESVFDDNIVTQTLYKSDRDSSHNYVPEIRALNNVGHRFCRLTLGNIIVKGDDWNTKGVQLRQDMSHSDYVDDPRVAYVGHLKMFDIFSSGYFAPDFEAYEDTLSGISGFLTSLITTEDREVDHWENIYYNTDNLTLDYRHSLLALLGTGTDYWDFDIKFNVSDYIKYNDWADWNNPNNAVYTKSNISRIPGVTIRTSKDDEFVTGASLEYPEGTDSSFGETLDEKFINLKLEDIYRDVFIKHTDSGLNVKTVEEVNSMTSRDYLNAKDVFLLLRTGIRDGHTITINNSELPAPKTYHYELCIGGYYGNNYLQVESLKALGVNTSFNSYTDPNFSNESPFVPFEHIPLQDISLDNDDPRGPGSEHYKNVCAVLFWKLVEDSTDDLLSSECRIEYIPDTEIGEYAYVVKLGDTIDTDSFTALKEFVFLALGKYHSNRNPDNLIYTRALTTEDKRRKRKVTTFKTSAYDFDSSKLNESAEKRAEWDALWEEWYPGITNPADIDTNIGSSDTTYLDFENIEVINNTEDNAFEIVAPPCIHIKRERCEYTYTADNKKHVRRWFRDYYIKCLNKHGIKPYEYIVDVTGGVFENHIRADELYDLTIENGNGTIEFCKGSTVPDTYKTKPFNDTAEIIGYYGKSVQENPAETWSILQAVVGFMDTNGAFWHPEFGAKKGILVDYKLEDYSMTIGATYVIQKTPEYQDRVLGMICDMPIEDIYQVAPNTWNGNIKPNYPVWYYAASEVLPGKLALYGQRKNGSSGWLSEVGLALSEGVINKYVDANDRRYILQYDGDFEKVSRAIISHNDKDGIVFAQPLWGHICKTLTYTGKKSNTEISNDIESTFDISQLEGVSAILTGAKDYILVDRETVGNKINRDWFGLELVKVYPDEKAQLRLKPVMNSELFYSIEDKSGTTNVSVNVSIDTGNTEKQNESETLEYYPSIVSYNGNMKSIGSNICQFDLRWTPDAFIMPISASFSFDTALEDKTHKFYANMSQIASSIECDIGSYTAIDNNGMLPIVLTFLKDPSKTVTLYFDTKLGSKGTITRPSAEEVTLDLREELDTEITVKTATNIDNGNNIPIKVDRYFSIDADFAKVDSPEQLNSWRDGLFGCTHVEGNKRYNYTYDSRLKILVNNSTNVSSEKISDGVEHVLFESPAAIINFNAILRNVADIDPETNTVTNTVTITYGNVNYAIDKGKLEELNSNVAVMATDIRYPNKKEHIGIIDVNNYQFVKQGWNTTTEVENFWWINPTHILELHSDRFVLKRKTDRLSDWDGDEFESVNEKLRAELIDEHSSIYTVTNMYKDNDDALLLIFYAKEELKVGCDIYSVIDDFKKIDTICFEIKRKEIGQKLNDVMYVNNTAYFNTYGQFTAKQLLSQAKWTNTYIDNRLIIGCHFSNNFDQWAAIFNAPNFTCSKCIQGYGFVGLNGSLTGGMIPKDYFEVSKGFSGTVEDISILNKSTDNNDADNAYIIKNITDINQIEPHVVGSAEKQWYIKKELQGIVSHLTYNNGLYSVESIPITNKYDSVYKSPSFFTYIVGDNMVQCKAFENLLNFTGVSQKAWSVICKACGYPLMYFFSPRISTFSYLQQTLGQYAYVHHNSAETDSSTELKNTASDNNMSSASKVQAPILSDELTFDKQIIEQSILNTAPFDQFLTLMFAMFAPPLAHIDRNLVINGEVNQTAVLDTGKKYTQFVMENLAGLGAKALLTESNEQALISKIAGIKSLDMFYSTSEKQKINAGPGFVEHQFTANCIAQSVTDVAAEGQVRQLTLILKSLTSFQGMLVIKLEDVIIDGLLWAANAVKELSIFGGVNIGAPVAAGMCATAQGLRYAQEATRLAYNAIDKVLDVMSQRGVICEDTGRVSRYALTPEGKHKYGEKSEVFLWPCMGIPEAGLTYTDETVDACIKKSTWQLNLQASKAFTQDSLLTKFTTHYDDLYSGNKVKFSSAMPGERTNKSTFNNFGDIDYYTASCFGKTTSRKLPADMACIQGVESFLPVQPFKNENISCGAPAFAPSLFHDFVIDKSWDITQCCTYGLQQWITVKDTKVTNCPPSNMYINDDFCGIATPYSAVEVKHGLSKSYMRPWAITPNVLALNCSGYNSIYNNKLYHAFDGMSYRIVEWKGSSAMNKNFQTFLYGFQVNDRFKRSNKFPANEALGNFDSEPTQYIDTIDKFWSQINIAAKEKGMEGGTIGEDKDATRWSLPIFTEPVTTLPAAVKTLTAMTLNVYDGVTGLVTNIANNQTAYKAPLSIDFTIGKKVYRQTEEYISSVETTEGIDIVTDIIPSLGLKFIGSTPTEAYFYSKATRCYYMFSGTTLIKMDMMERFRDIQRGFWDFVNQEVIMPCLMTFKRLNPEVSDKDTETDNIIVPVLSKGQVTGEVIPPLTTIFNDRSWYKCVSLPIGFAYQGPNRVIINSSVFTEYMLDSLKGNIGKWKRLDREKYTNKREYPEVYNDVVTEVNGVEGWTYNPFLLVTSALGLNEDVDCLFEWNITFCWPVEMDLIYGNDNYACVNLMSETMTPGGRQKSRPTHVFLTKELFTRNGNYGYYSFRFQSKNGAGNRERLHIWSDQYIAISRIDCEVKPITQRRTEQLTQQQDVMKLKEL